MVEGDLYYYGARWYDPLLGRFIQADTIVPSAQGTQAFDRYAYVNNNPLRYTDPSGNTICDEFGNCYVRPGERLPSQSSSLPTIKVHYLPGPRVTNYNITRAIKYASERREEDYKNEAKLFGDNLCTIFAMDTVTSPYGGGWKPHGVDPYSEEFRTNEIFYWAPSAVTFMKEQADVTVSDYLLNEFQVDQFKPGDLVSLSQKGEIRDNHLVFVTSVDLAKNEVWIVEMSGSSDYSGREFRDVITPIISYRVIRISEYDK
jgi:RHS repeat-associated protein